MTELQIEQILQALSDFCDAQDSATQTLRNSLKLIHTATFTPAAEAHKPPAPKPQPKTDLDFNPNICNWEDASGARGPFQVCKAGTNFQLLLSYLKSREGHKATLDGTFYWVMTDGDKVGRKQVAR